MWPLAFQKVKPRCALGHVARGNRTRPRLANPCPTRLQAWHSAEHLSTGDEEWGWGWNLSHRALKLATGSTKPQRFQGGMAPDSPPHPSQPQAAASAPDLPPAYQSPAVPLLGHSWLRIPWSWVGRPRPLGPEASQAHLCSGCQPELLRNPGFACLLDTKLP